MTMNVMFRLLVLPALLASSPVWALDGDGDGVDDLLDAFPCDPSLAAESFAPGEGAHAALLFEDRWPALGDADFNDAVLTYNYAMREDASGRVKGLTLTVNVIAFGGTMNLGLGLGLPVSRAAVASVTRQVGGAAPEALTPSAADADLVVELSRNLREVFGGREGPINALGTSTLPGLPLTIEVTFATPVELDPGQAPHDIFLFRSDDPTHELHRPGYRGTARMNTSLFGTGSDGTVAEGLSFIDTRGLPFALHLPVYSTYPAELVEISRLWPRILAFAASGGVEAQDFYATPNLAAAFAGTPPIEPVLAVPPVRDRSCVQTAVACSSTEQVRVEPGTVISASNVSTFEDRTWVVPAGVTVTVDLARPLSVTCLDIAGVVVPAACTTSRCNPLDLAVRGEAHIRAGGRIDASGRGHLGAHDGGNGGQARSLGNAATAEVGLYSGGSHGGFGGPYPGQSVGRTYGDPLAPLLPGGGGRGYSDGGWGTGGSGGGAIRLTVAGRLQLDGQVLANGATGAGSYPSSGAGGSVWIEAGEIASASTGLRVQASGGSAYHGSGGGGRIAIYSPRLLWTPTTETVAARGGASSVGIVGGPGTVVVGADVRSAELRVHAPAGGLSAFGATPVGAFGAITALDDSTLTTSARLEPGSLVGRTLKPDLAGSRTFTITANTGNTIRVVGGLLGATAVGRSFVVTDHGNRFAAMQVLGHATVDVGALHLAGDLRLSGSAVVTGDQAVVGGLVALADSARLDLRTLGATTLEQSGSSTLVAEQVQVIDGALSGTSRATARPPTTAGVRPLTIVATRDFSLGSSARLTVDALGYLGAHSGGNAGLARTAGNVATSGVGLYSGGSHGGFGGPYPGQGTGAVFGDLYRPADAGGGGRGYLDGGWGAGGNGGGVLRLDVGRNLSLDGVISADGGGGGGSYPSGGAGGAVWVTVGGTLSRATAGIGVRANGASGYHGAGGGGRIALYASSLTMVVDATSVEAVGGASTAGITGGPGTIAFGAGPSVARLLVHSPVGRVSARGPTPVRVPDGSVPSFSDLRVSGGATVDFDSVTVEGDAAFVGSSRGNGGVLTVSGTLSSLESASLDITTVDAGTFAAEGSSVLLAELVRARDLRLSGSARFSPRASTTAGIRALTVDVARDLALGSGTSFDASGRGYLGAHEAGNGAQPRTFGNTVETEVGLYTGGSHAGFGGQYGSHGVGRTYGDALGPVEGGGGGRGYSDGGQGAGGTGGGVLRVVVGRDLALDGLMTANGLTGSGSYPSGGAGGSIWVTVGRRLSRAGAGVGVRANGGNGYHGAGGGGRVALFAGDLAWSVASTTVEAVGGASTAGMTGGPGTIAFGVSPAEARLLVHSPGRPSAFGATPVGVSGVITALTDTTLTTSARLVPGALVGRTLRPDRDGEATMAITANGAGTITVAGGLLAATAVGRTFHVSDFNTRLVGLTVSGASGVDFGVLQVDGPVVVNAASARFDALRATTISLEAGSSVTGGALAASERLTVSGSAQVDVVATTAPVVRLQGNSVTRGERVEATTLDVEGSAQLTHRLPGVAGFRPLSVAVEGQLTVASGARIHVDGGGYLGAHAGGNGALPRAFGNGTSSETGLYTGGSHGGWGGQYPGQGVGRPYGDVYAPVEAGGGGRGYSDGNQGAGGNGGGALRIAVGQGFALEGVVSADGANGGGSYPSGGAGGSVWITVGGAFTRSAGGVAVRANGAGSYHGAGAGGRVALYAGSFGAPVTASSVQAIGGTSSAGLSGGPGTIVWGAGPDDANLLVSTPAGRLSARGPTPIGVSGRASAVNGAVITTSQLLVPGSLVGRTVQTDLVNRNRGFVIIANTGDTITVEAALGDALAAGQPFYVEDHHTRFASVTLDDAATVDAGFLEAVGSFLARGTSSTTLLQLDAGTLRVEGSARLAVSDVGGVEVLGDADLADTARLLVGRMEVVGHLGLAGSAVLTGHAPTVSRVATIDITADRVTVGASARISGTGLGYLGAHDGGNGSLARGAGNAQESRLGLYSGGSHGGLGGQYPGQSVGPVHGARLAPVTPGGGGRGYSDGVQGTGGTGGTALRLQAATSLRLDGVIEASGATGSGSYPSAGAGGSIWVTTGSLSGAGRFEARGGNAYHGSGGGGRIAVEASSGARPSMVVTAGASTAGILGAAGSAVFNGE